MQGFRPKIIRAGDGRFGKRASGSGVYRNPRSRRNRYPTERFAKQASFAKTSRRCSVSTVRRRRTPPAEKPRPLRRTDARRHSPVPRPFGGQHTHVRRIYRMDQGNFRGDASRKTMQASFPSLLVFRLYDCTPDVVLRQNRTGRLFLCPAFPTSAAPKPPPLGNVRINSTLPPLIRIFDFVSDTSSRHNQTNVCFCTRLFVSLADAEDTPVRHNQAGACFCPHLFVSLYAARNRAAPEP